MLNFLFRLPFEMLLASFGWWMLSNLWFAG